MSHRIHSLETDENHSNLATGDEISDADSTRVNDGLVKLSETFSPILKVMKFTGEYFGDTSLDSIPRLGAIYFSRYYSAAIVFGQWLMFAMGMTTLIHEGLSSMKQFLYLLLICTWYLQCACVTTISFVALPLTHNRQSKFARFIGSYVADAAVQDKLAKKVRWGLILTCCIASVNIIILLLLDVVQSSSIALLSPWDGLLVFRAFFLVFGAFNTAAWVLPVLFFCVTCECLVTMFENLHKKISTQMLNGSLDISLSRKEYMKLCETVELADNVLSPTICAIISLNIPMLCMNFYEIVNLPSDEKDVIFFVTFMYWCIGLISILALIIVFGTRVNEKAHSFYKTFQSVDVAQQDSKERTELLLLMIHLGGEPIGLSVGGLLVIDKSLFLTLLGIILSYFTVLITLPSGTN